MNTTDNGVRPHPIVVQVSPENMDTSMGLYAAHAWVREADAMGLKMSVWAEQGVASRVGPEGGTVAELDCWGAWHVVVDTGGRTSAHLGNDDDCSACADLRTTGAIGSHRQ